MLDTLTRGVRYVSVTMTAISFAGALALIYVGAEKMARGIWDYLTGTLPPSSIPVAQRSDAFIVRALESLDAFLIAIALITFGYGVLTLIVLPQRPSAERVPKVLAPDSFTRLKESLTQVVLVVLTVYFVRVLWLEQEELDFTLWAIPGSIFLIALAARVSGVVHGEGKVPGPPDEGS